jgi:hypothetical protein
MNIYTPIIFEEVVQHTFTPNNIFGTDSEWIQKFNLLNFGNGGEILSINVDVVGAPGLGHGIERFSFWISKYDFSSLITGPRTLYQSNRGPSTSDTFLWSGDLLAGSNVTLDKNHSVYNEAYVYPVPYITSPNFQLAFTARGTNLLSTIKFTIRGRRTQ